MSGHGLPVDQSHSKEPPPIRNGCTCSKGYVGEDVGPGNMAKVAGKFRDVRQLASAPGCPGIQHSPKSKCKQFVICIDSKPPTFEHEVKMAYAGEAGIQLLVKCQIWLLCSFQLLGEKSQRLPWWCGRRPLLQGGTSVSGGRWPASCCRRLTSQPGHQPHGMGGAGVCQLLIGQIHEEALVVQKIYW